LLLGPEKSGLLDWLGLYRLAETGVVRRWFGPRDELDEADLEYENVLGISAAIRDARMLPVEGVHEQTFTASVYTRHHELASGGRVHFTFERAFVGDYDYPPAGRAVRGAHVSLAVKVVGCGEHEDVRLVQVLRNIALHDGEIVTAEPNSARRQQRSGWGDPCAPSRGWRVDELDHGHSPFYVTSSFYGHHGSSRRPAKLRDSPGDWITDRNMGKEFRTCAVSYTRGRVMMLACIDWGYTIDEHGQVSFFPYVPTAMAGAPEPFVDAITRWDAMAGNTPVGL
jgi:hypothetical protein